MLKLISILLILIFGCTDSYIEKERLSKLISQKDSLISSYQEQIKAKDAEIIYLSLSSDTLAILSYRVGYLEGKSDAMNGIYFKEDERAEKFENRFIIKIKYIKQK